MNDFSPEYGAPEWPRVQSKDKNRSRTPQFFFKGMNNDEFADAFTKAKLYAEAERAARGWDEGTGLPSPAVQDELSAMFVIPDIEQL